MMIRLQPSPITAIAMTALAEAISNKELTPGEEAQRKQELIRVILFSITLHFAFVSSLRTIQRFSSQRMFSNDAIVFWICRRGR